MKHFSLMLVMVLFAVSTTFAQRTITGTVMLSDEGEAIGANVVVDGNEGVGTTTEFDGTFSLSVPDEATALKISYTGYTTQTVSIEGVSSINVTLEPGELLSTVVVTTPYFTKTRGEQTGSVSNVGKETIERVPIATVDNILQGQVAGLQIMAGTGQPGQGAGKVQLRGAGTVLGASEPLFFVDGVRVDQEFMSNINPSDIEDVSVLKDAASTSLYGASGANGVILVKTKSGVMKDGAPTEVVYRTQYGFNTPSQEKFEMMSSSEKLAMEKYLGEQGVGPSRNRPGYYYGSESSPGYNQSKYDSLASINNNWKDYIFRTSIMKQHDLSLRGGSQRTSFFVSGSFLDQEGQAVRSDLTRASTRFNIQHKINDKFTVGMNATMGYSRTNLIEGENAVALNNPFTSVYLANPYESPYNADGSYNIERPTATNPVNGLANSVNVIERTNKSSNQRDELKGIGNVFVSYKLFEGLTLKTDWGIDYLQRTAERWIDPESVAGKRERGGAGSFRESYLRQPAYQGRLTATYEKIFGAEDEHKLFFVLGGEMQKEKFRSFGYIGYKLDPKLPRTNTAITNAFTAQDYQIAPTIFSPNTRRHTFSQEENSLLSYLFNADYIYKGKYIFTGSLRRDASSKFGKNKRWGTFWALGAAWNISDEAFLSDVTWLDRLKLGFSIGTSGNSKGISDFQSRSVYSPGNYGTNITYVQSVIGSPDLKWEVQRQAGLSIDFGMLNRINGSIELYNNITSDLFLQQSLPPSASGSLNSLRVNSGKMRNRGIDFNLSVDIIKTEDLSWKVNGNLNYNDNEIIDLGGQDEFEFGTSVAQVGKPFNSHYVVEWAGVDPATGQALYYDKKGNITSVFSADNRTTNHGTSEPPFVGGFGTSLNYKGFSLAATFSFVQGNTIFNNQSFFQQNHNFSQFNLSNEMNNIWKKPGDVTEIQGAVDPVTGGTSVRAFSSKDIEDGSFLRFRNLSLAYDLPVSKINGLNKVFSRVKVFGVAQNLFTLTKFTGFDPEIDNNIAQYEYPVPRTFTFGLEVGF